MRPRFLDQPFFSQRTPRDSSDRAQYGSAFHDVTPRRRVAWEELFCAIAVVAAFALIGVMLGWRG